MAELDGMQASPPALFDPEFLRALERLSLVARRTSAGSLRGDQRSPRRGASIEFADYRDYAPGDDLRHLDWNIYGRLDKLVLKLFIEEEDLRVHLLLDRSRSMAFGQPSKFDHARRLLAALAYLGLAGLDRVAATSFAERLDPGLRLLRGRGNAGRVFGWLSGLTAVGETALNDSLARFAYETARPGLVVVLSDFLDPAGYDRGLRALAARRHEVVALQVLAPEELEPTVVGDLRLLDGETGAAREVTISASLLRRYRTRARDYCDELARSCRARGLSYLRTTTAEPVETLVQASLRRLGLVR